ncbi:trypsin-like serine peptidase [Kitasatospora sp. NPDC004272]
MERSVGAAVSAALPALAAAGCGSSGDGGPDPSGGPVSPPSPVPAALSSGGPAAAVRGWSRERLRAALDKHRGTTRAAARAPSNSRVGAVFAHGADGDHFCTAGVVDSPGRNLLITAAHCRVEPRTGRTRTDLVFAPGYRDGDAPSGVRPLDAVTVAPARRRSGAPDADVAFATVRPQDGRQVREVPGGNLLGTDRGYALEVEGTGHPSGADQPITCGSTTGERSPARLRIDCPGYTGGTSGTSCSGCFGPRVRGLYEQASGGS